MIVQKLITDNDGKFKWVLSEASFGNKENKRKAPVKDPTIDQHIAEHGGIFSHADCKTYTTKRAYLDSLKAQGKVIMDW